MNRSASRKNIVVGLTLAGLLFGLVVVWPVTAQSTRPATQPVNVDAEGLAIKGFDPVAYFKQNKAVPGDPAITAHHGGATYRFATQEHKHAFEQNPSAFVPAFGGYCGYGVAKGVLAPTDPTVFQIIDGKLILQYDAGAAKIFSQDEMGNLAKATENWKILAREK